MKLIHLRSDAPRHLPKLFLDYGTAPTPFGDCLGAFRGNALFYLCFYDAPDHPIDKLKAAWPTATLSESQAAVGPKLCRFFEDPADLEVYLMGTEFEFEVWEFLLKIGKGTTVSYEDVAVGVGRPKAVRAAARAVAKNRVSYFVPCHRVIKKDGSLHRYGGGAERKAAMLRLEGAI